MSQLRAPVKLLNRSVLCKSCLGKCRGTQLPTWSKRRLASTLSSNTAVNASRSVPDKYKALYSALDDVRRNASGHFNVSRLQLALQSLESTSPKIRIAVLGLNVQDTARRIVRLLLADPLEKSASWEKDLADDATRYEHGLVVRFGQPANPNIPPSKTSIPTLDVPSRLLEKNNLEILVSAVNGLAAGRQQRTPIETFLAPVVGTPTAYSGRQTMISQPVHNALVVAHGLGELLQVAELLASTDFVSPEDKASIRVALQQAAMAGDGQVMTVDAAKAEEGLEAIRRSLSEATTYEHQWVNSGMPKVAQWLALAAPTEGAIPAQVYALISSILKSADASLDAESKRAVDDRKVDSFLVNNLHNTIDEFSRNAHRELQSGLASAWSSRNWRKLAWYKLFWRVDDVGLIVNDLITNAWLPRTERAVYELSGRLAQAGISPTDVTTPPPEFTQKPIQSSPSTQPLPILQAQAVPSEIPTEPVITNQGGSASIVMQPAPRLMPLSASISATRTNHISRAIDSLSSQAQQLVLRTLSISGLSAGLSGLTYVSITPDSFYEAGTIVAVGTAFALWQMQGGWQRATDQMKVELFDEGRSTIIRIVDRMQSLIRHEAEGRVDQPEVQRRRTAQDSVKRAQFLLDELISQDPSNSK